MSKHIRTLTYQEPLRVRHLTQGCLGVQIGVAKQINDRRGNETLQWAVRPFSKMEVQPEPLTDRSLHTSFHSRRHGDTHSSASANRATPWVPRSAFARKRQLDVCSPSLALRPSRRPHLNLYFCHRHQLS